MHRVDSSLDGWECKMIPRNKRFITLQRGAYYIAEKRVNSLQLTQYGVIFEPTTDIKVHVETCL